MDIPLTTDIRKMIADDQELKAMLESRPAFNAALDCVMLQYEATVDNSANFAAYAYFDWNAFLASLRAGGILLTKCADGLQAELLKAFELFQQAGTKVTENQPETSQVNDLKRVH